MSADPECALAPAHALGVLDAGEQAAFEAHVASCSRCARELEAEQAALGRLGAAWVVPPAPELRTHVLELAEAPQAPVSLGAYSWDEVLPGIRMHVLKDDPARGLRTVLVWGKPGARYPSHRHLGDEEILVLEGELRDHRGVYGPGSICRSRAGSVHSEEVVGSVDCVCFVVYHGGHEPA
jgi:anti-sigma factor ChrR (cupin superfamily)